MQIFKLSRDIDGYGGKLRDEYVTTYEKAVEMLKNTSALYYDEETNTWDIDGMKSCVTGNGDCEGSFSLYGIRYPENEMDDHDIQYCRCSIEPIDLFFELDGDSIWIMYRCNGYNTYLKNPEIVDRQEYNEPIGYYKSKKSARKVAARDKRLKHIARLWEKPEYDERISVFGSGEDYLSIVEVKVN